MIDVARAELHATIYWYKNNKGLFVSMIVWPYLMTGLLLALGMVFGSPENYARRMGVSNPAMFLLSASVVAMSSLNVIDTVAGYALYNRWLGTLDYILLTPTSLPKILIAAGLPGSMIGATITVTSILPAALYYEGLNGLVRLLGVYVLIILGMLPLLGFSVLAASVLLFVREESNVLNSIIPFLLLVSGVFYPVELLPGILQAVSRAVPVSYVVSAAKTLSGAVSSPAIYTAIYALTVMTVAYNLTAFLVIGKAGEAVRRRGVP